MQVSLYKYSAVSLASILLGLIVIASSVSTVHSNVMMPAFPRCGPCMQGLCVSSTDECRYHGFTDSCGRNVCNKGPDEKCGGPYDFYGKCGHGLVCKCNQCVGCSMTTMECSSHNNPQC